MDIAISTTFRQPLYIHEMLDSMFRDERAHAPPLRYVVCGTDEHYLGNWLRHGRAEPCDEMMWRDRMRDLPPEGRCLRNFERVLEGGNDALLALEDDIVFTSGWMRKLDEALARVAARRGPKRKRKAFVLALYAARPFKLRPVANYNPLHFYGNQALYLSPEARVRLRSFIAQELAAGRPQPADMMVKAAACEDQFDLLAVHPNLCQHIGASSSLGLRPHRSPSYRP